MTPHRYPNPSVLDISCKRVSLNRFGSVRLLSRNVVEIRPCRSANSNFGVRRLGACASTLRTARADANHVNDLGSPGTARSSTTLDNR